ncbi:MAG TPA: RNA 2',3'-cyclic phosphodiesterase [Alphaproteobacteria bacterium]|nr:RNA 2',3'-cyclic phosphodiesterase [Alphaproteobacteria bacterium]
MIRLFVGLALPEAVQRQLDSLCAGVPGARWVATESRHLTLRFIGDVPESVAADVDDALSEIESPAFDMTLEGISQFSNRSQARMIWIGTERNERLMHLAAKVESAVVRAGLEPEGRKFIPHVTLARLKDVRVDQLGPYLADHALFRAGPFDVDRFVLFSSFLSRNGAIYTPEAEYPLKGAPSA